MNNPVALPGHFRRLGALLALALSMWASSAPAMEPLRFDAKPGPTSKVLLDRHFQSLEPAQTTPPLAAIDLNEDGLDEFIAQTACKADGICQYLVLAESRSAIVQLGLIAARTLALGSAYSGGVRNIIAYKAGDNDFTPTLYIWEPASRQYMIKEE